MKNTIKILLLAGALFASVGCNEEEFLNDLIEGMFMKPNASNLSPQISTNCCLDLSVKPNPNESTKYLKSKVSLLTSDLNKGVPLETKLRI